jgi:hypothetical protein
MYFTFLYFLQYYVLNKSKKLKQFHGSLITTPSYINILIYFSNKNNI